MLLLFTHTAVIGSNFIYHLICSMSDRPIKWRLIRSEYKTNARSFNYPAGIFVTSNHFTIAHLTIFVDSSSTKPHHTHDYWNTTKLFYPFPKHLHPLYLLYRVGNIWRYRKKLGFTYFKRTEVSILPWTRRDLKNDSSLYRHFITVEWRRNHTVNLSNNGGANPHSPQITGHYSNDATLFTLDVSPPDHHPKTLHRPLKQLISNPYPYFY